MKMLQKVPLVLFLVLLGKLIASNTQLFDILTLAVAAAFVGLTEILNYKEKLTVKNKQLEFLENEINTLKKDHEALKTHVAGLKLSTQMRQSNVR